MSFKCKVCGPDSTFSCTAGNGYSESHAKMHGLGVGNKKNEVANDIDYDGDRVSVGITVDAPVTAVSNKTNDIQCFKDI